MKKERFEKQFNVKAAALPWKRGNGFIYAELGPYCVYVDGSWGYYVTRDNSVLHWRVDLSRYLT